MNELLRRFTPARVDIGRAGDAVPTRESLEFQLAHARARDAVHAPFDAHSLLAELQRHGWPAVLVHSAAPDRAVYLKRPDLGRKLDPASRTALVSGDFDVVFTIADGLSALAAERHAVPLLDATLPLLQGLRIAPILVAAQARVALADEIGAALNARIAAMLIGERPGMSAPDSLGAYVTWNPRPGRTDADRNCISNIRTEGMSYSDAARRLAFLLREGIRRKLTGVHLKEAALLD